MMCEFYYTLSFCSPVPKSAGPGLCPNLWDFELQSPLFVIKYLKDFFLQMQFQEDIGEVIIIVA